MFNPTRPRGGHAVYLGSIIVLAGILRFHKLGMQSLWFDELFSFGAGAQSNVYDVVIKGAAQDQHPPGYPLLIHFLTRHFAPSEWLLRLPSALAGTATVGVMFGLGARLHSVRVGLVAAGLATVHWFSIYYSQESRPYAILLLGTALSALLAVEIANRHRQRSPTWHLFGTLVFVGIATSYVHYYGVLFLLLLGLLMFALGRRKHVPLWPSLAAFGTMALAYLPWVGIVWHQASGRGGWMRRTSPAVIWKSFESLSSGHPLLLLFILVLAWLVYRSAGRRSSSREQGVPPHDLQTGERALLSTRQLVRLLAFWFVAPLALQILVTRAGLPIFSIRNLIITLPAIILGGALALSTLDWRLSREIPIASLVVCGLLLFDLQMGRQYYARYTKEPFREIAKQLVASGDTAPEIYGKPGFVAGFLNLYFVILGSPLRAQRLDGPVPSPSSERVWVVCRGCRAEAVAGYAQLDARQYTAEAIDLWRPKVFHVVHFGK